MRLTSSRLLNLILATLLLASIFAIGFATTTTGNMVTSIGEYDPWVNINDDSIINIKDASIIGINWLKHA